MNATKSKPKSRHYVAPDEFVGLLISNRRLVRCDEPGSTIRGLLDLESGQRYMIRQTELERVQTRN